MIEFKFRSAKDAMPRSMAGLGAADQIDPNKQHPLFNTRAIACPCGGMRS